MSNDTVSVDPRVSMQLAEIRKRLGDLESKAPSILMNALNATGRAVRKQIVMEAKNEYKITKSGMMTLNNAMPIAKRASRADLTVILKSEGPMNDLMSFMVSPKTISRGTVRPDSYMAQVLKAGGSKMLDGDPKPFVTQFRSGHIAIAVRVPGRKMVSDPSKDFIKKLLSPAVPHMLNNDDIQEKAQKMVEEILPQKIDALIAKTLASAKV